MIMFCPGLKEAAAARKWKELFSDHSVKRDQVEAVNTEGQPLGKACSNLLLSIDICILILYTWWLVACILYIN